MINDPSYVVCPVCARLCPSAQGTLHQCFNQTIDLVWDNEFIDTSTIPVEMLVTGEERDMILAHRAQQEKNATHN